jgi:DNA-binding CsgD family transcriptional regulator
VPSTDIRLDGMQSSDNLKRGRDAYARRAWSDAYDSLSRADRERPLPADTLERLAVAAYLIGRADAYANALDRAHHAHLEAGERERAARCAFWLGLDLMLRGETGASSGWLARAERLLQSVDRRCAEHGYLLLPVAERQLAAGDHEAAYAAAAHAADIGERFADADLTACSRHVQGRALMLQRQLPKGLALLDEVMVAVTSGELSPLMTGLIYCSVIGACQQLYLLDRACEWTCAFARWCDAQPEMIAFSGICRVHRAEIMQLQGAWNEAIEEAARACARCQGTHDAAVGAAWYQQAEVHRLRGAYAAAEEGFQKASQCGWDPQPGLALLRLAQGRANAAAAAMRRAIGEMRDPLQRARLLPACVEVMIAVNDIEEARSASRELDQIATSFATDVRLAIAAQARAALELAEGDARAALGGLRGAQQVWRRIEAPYLAARARLMTGLGCMALGDDDGAALELRAAHGAFERLQAAPDLVRIDALTRRVTPGRPGGLTSRELQVLRLVSTGRTNKAIAAELSLSEKTVDRHLSNILTKLDVRSRAAATAYACTHKLV